MDFDLRFVDDLKKSGFLAQLGIKSWLNGRNEDAVNLEFDFGCYGRWQWRPSAAQSPYYAGKTIAIVRCGGNHDSGTDTAPVGQ